MKRWPERLMWWLILISLSVFVITLPFWNPFPMDLFGKVSWWVFFGGAMVYIWVQFTRKIL